MKSFGGCRNKVKQLSLQSIAVPREDWYWPKTESNDEEDDQNEEEQEEEETVDLTVSITFLYLRYNIFLKD